MGFCIKRSASQNFILTQTTVSFYIKGNENPTLQYFQTLLHKSITQPAKVPSELDFIQNVHCESQAPFCSKMPDPLHIWEADVQIPSSLSSASGNTELNSHPLCSN